MSPQGIRVVFRGGPKDGEMQVIHEGDQYKVFRRKFGPHGQEVDKYGNLLKEEGLYEVSKPKTMLESAIGDSCIEYMWRGWQ